MGAVGSCGGGYYWEWYIWVLVLYILLVIVGEAWWGW